MSARRESVKDLAPLQTSDPKNLAKKRYSVREFSYVSSTVSWNTVNLSDDYNCVRKLGEGGQAAAFLLSDVHFPEAMVVAKIYRDTPSIREMVTNEIKVLKHLNRDGCKSFLLCFQRNFVSPVSGLPQKCKTSFSASDTVLVVVYDYFFGPGTKDLKWLLEVITYNEEDYLEFNERERKRLQDIASTALTPNFVLTLIVTLIRAVAFLHENDVAHLDLKPANVILNMNNGRIQLIDFGIACMEKKCEPLGTPTHMAPEVAKAFGKRQKTVDLLNPKQTSYTKKVFSLSDAIKADAWSIGILIFEYVHGELPYEWSSLDRIMYHIGRASQHEIAQFDSQFPDPDINEVINIIVNGFLQVDPGRRMSVLEAKEILDPLVINEPSSPYSASPLRFAIEESSSRGSPASPNFPGLFGSPSEVSKFPKLSISGISSPARVSFDSPSSPLSPSISSAFPSSYDFSILSARRSKGARASERRERQSSLPSPSSPHFLI